MEEFQYISDIFNFDIVKNNYKLAIKYLENNLLKTPNHIKKM